MKNISALLLTLFCACLYSKAQTFRAPQGKEIYIPNDLHSNDFTQDTSRYSFARMATTPDIAVFWEKPFGNDLSQAPALDGHNMKVDLPNLMKKLQQFYNYFKNDLGFVLPGSKTERYRMMVMLNYSLEGTAYGGDYDGQIGALWVTPQRIQDTTLNCIAHELGHSFQAQIGCDGQGDSWGGGGIFEMASQWMLWKVNPLWPQDENYHWQAFRKSHHKRFLDVENIYRSPYVLEYWSMLHGDKEIARLFREGKRGEDPATTYMRIHGISLEQMNREMADCYSRLCLMDFPRVKDVCQAQACELQSMDKPGTWGFNVKEIPADMTSFTFKNLSQDPNAGFRYQVVAIDAQGRTRYEGIRSGNTRKPIKLRKVREGERRFLVVVACPEHTYTPYLFNPYDPNSKAQKEPDYKYAATFYNKNHSKAIGMLPIEE